MKKLLTVVFAMFMTSTVYAAEPHELHVKNAAGLAEICGLSAEDARAVNAKAFCRGYLVGAYQYYDATIDPAKRFVCSPKPTPSLDEVTDGFVAWSKTHPQYMQDRAADTLFRYLAENYPCGKEQ
nr:Rap1a/Tai family immunity protein [uncultured Desulfobulbus sp.]